MRKVLITGGSRGIGEAILRRFRQNGDAVVFFYHANEEQALDVSTKTGAVAMRCDVGNPAEVKKVFAEAVELLGGLDILVNNAGISFVGLSRDMSDETYAAVLSTNLSGAFYLSREAQGVMIPQHSGKMINIGSMWGKTGASCEVAYSASKAGIRGLTMALAKELGPSGITVNCVEPGLIDTAMNAALGEETKRELVEETPLCRIGRPEDVANAVFFFASTEADFITGQILGVDGGFAV